MTIWQRFLNWYSRQQMKGKVGPDYRQWVLAVEELGRERVNRMTLADWGQRLGIAEWKGGT